jgi:excisionase family DNA binding protein
VSERLLTARDVADLLGLTVETVLRWYRRRVLPGYKLPGGPIRFREAELEAWLEARSTRAGTTTQESPDTRGRARRPGPYPLPWPAPDTRPQDAARTQEDD